MQLLQSVFQSEAKYGVVEKAVGETPLQALERFRSTRPSLDQVSLAYAGRLDPMASGKLLVLIGKECKKQKAYHDLDKAYEFSVLFGASSDTGDVLGVVAPCTHKNRLVQKKSIHALVRTYTGDVSFPYPRYSSKTVRGKPLFRWALENRLDEIDVPMNSTRIHVLKCVNYCDISKEDLEAYVFEKIESLPPVTEQKKALGKDFRRDEVRASWHTFFEEAPAASFPTATFRCIVSAGTYVRSVSEALAADLGSCGLALSIHRTKIGRYRPLLRGLGLGLGVWKKRY